MIWSVKDLQLVLIKIFSFLYLIFHICCWDHTFLNCSLDAVSIQVCTAKMNLSDEVDLEDYVCRPDKISAADVSPLSLQGFNIIIKQFAFQLLEYWLHWVISCMLSQTPLTCKLLHR